MTSVARKLVILADAAKYDASCSSSGGSRRDSRDQRGIGSTTGSGICHSYAPDGRCISLLKILLTNWCVYDCLYCINRVSSDVERARFSVAEVVSLTLDFYRRNVIEGLFLSSGIIRSPDYTMEQLVAVARELRETHQFRGYLHLKTIPDASEELLAAAGRYADRLSINIELPTQPALDALAPGKNLQQIRTSMAGIRLRLDEYGEATMQAKRVRSMPASRPGSIPPPRFAPAGQSTQMIVGADESDDRTILKTSALLYANYRLKRVYYSAFSPIPYASHRLPGRAAPLMREHRLYQADWLMRFYGFEERELVSPGGMLSLEHDPKMAWALAHPERFPVDVNRAPREMLLRVPGLGVKSVQKLLTARRYRTVRHADISRLGPAGRRALDFIVLPDHRPPRVGSATGGFTYVLPEDSVGAGGYRGSRDVDGAGDSGLAGVWCSSLASVDDIDAGVGRGIAIGVGSGSGSGSGIGLGSDIGTSRGEIRSGRPDRSRREVPAIVRLGKSCHRIDIDVEDVDPSLTILSALLAANVDPDAVFWRERDAVQNELFDDSALAGSTVAPERKARARLSSMPAGFAGLARLVAMHCEPTRFIRLHRMAIRLDGEPSRWLDTLDPDRVQLERMAREVRREIHKMHAFVRFRVLADEVGAVSAVAAIETIGRLDAVDVGVVDNVGHREGERRVAWFEPRHAILRAAAPFFLKRFAAMHWSILTPRLSAHWDRARLQFGPGVDRAQAPPADAGEALWLAYYRSIFNPSRLNASLMVREMPRRYWANLPESVAISELIRAAPARSAQMQEDLCDTLRRLPARVRPERKTSSSKTNAELNAVFDVDAAIERQTLSTELRLHDLASRARHCRDCECANLATQTVWGEGATTATLMIVGEQPGDQEDLAGRPFVGPAGQLLRKAIARLGWPMTSLYLTNAVKHFRFEPRGKRRIHKTPGQLEMMACAQWLEAEITQVRPHTILALGSTAATSLMGRRVRVGDSAGLWLYRDDGLPVWVVHHPAAVLRRAESGAPSFDAWVAAMRPAMDMDDHQPPTTNH